jgi:sugar/nucleoside kinase (ribokinase family)
MRREIVVLGDLNLDIIVSGLRALPELGHELLAEGCAQKAGGSCANTAIVLKWLDWPVSLYSQIGDDRVADGIQGELAAIGLDTRTITRTPAHPTGVTLALTFEEDRSYITAPGTLSSLTLGGLNTGYLRAHGHLHLASFFLQRALQAEVGALLQEAKGAGMSTSLDPGHDPTGQWCTAALQPFWGSLDWFLPNAKEFMAITRADTLDEAFRRFPPEVKGVVVKNGSEGAVVRHNGIVRAFPAVPARAVDTSCAGDCFNAGFLLGLCGDASLEEAVKLGNAFGAAAVSFVGLPPAEILCSIASRKE